MKIKGQAVHDSDGIIYDSGTKGNDILFKVDIDDWVNDEEWGKINNVPDFIVKCINFYIDSNKT